MKAHLFCRSLLSGPLALALAALSARRLLSPPPGRSRSSPSSASTRSRRFPGRCPAASSGTPTGSGSPSCAAPAEASSLYALDVTTGARRPLLLDGAKAVVPGEKPRPLPLAAASWLPDGHTLLVPAAGDIFTVDVRTGAVRALVQTPETEEYAEASPDGARVAFVRKSDLWVVDVASGRETRLTQGGSDTLLNGRSTGSTRRSSRSRSGQAFLWSPDSTAIAYLQLDQSRVPDLPHRGLRAGAQRGRVAALPEGGRPELRRAARCGRPREGRHARPRAARLLHARRRLRPAPARLDARLPPGGLPAPATGPRTSWSCACCPCPPRPASRSGRPAPC